MPAEREDFPVARVAALARLRLSPGETTLYQEQLGRILAFFDQVAAADFGAPAAGAATVQPPAAERPDAVCPSLGSDAALANAPDASGLPRLVRVPKVLGS
jgi:aspartyl-tRNA(Asn)/glutamyl-tRNA(Gln) amidotransferase subunit C